MGGYINIYSFSADMPLNQGVNNFTAHYSDR